MGGGIATMHYIGMTALHASAHMEHAPDLVVASVAVAIAASGLALWLAGGRGPAAAAPVGGRIRDRDHRHALHCHGGADGVPPTGAPALSTDLLAIVVAIVAFLVSAIFLLALVPERAGGQASPGFAGLAPPVAGANGREPAGAATEPATAAADLGQGTFAPLGGAGGPPRRLARHLPIERDGATHFFSVDKVVAVHANSHYTYVFDGRAKLFCPLAIGDVEFRLDSGRFARVHRSHIVNMERIVGLKRRR